MALSNASMDWTSKIVDRFVRRAKRMSLCAPIGPVFMPIGDVVCVSNDFI